MTFPSTLACLRSQRRMSQSRLAVDAGYSAGYVSRLESGARLPTRDAVVRLAAALGLTDIDRDRLLASAGFLPNDAVSLVNDEPALLGVARLLADPSVPADLRDLVRQDLARLTDLVRRAAATEVGR